MKWWERWPGRLSREVERLRARGFKTEFDENAALASPIVIAGTYPLDGIEYKLEIRFPDLYPYFRAEVFAPDLDLPHHQNPLGKNLCLIGRNSDNWDTNDLIADLIAEQLPEVLKSEELAEAGGQPNEELQAEPWTEYLVPNPGIRIMWNAAIAVPTAQPGKLELAYIPRQDFFSAFVSSVKQGDTVLFSESTQPISGAITREWFPFIRLDHKPPSPTGIGDMLRTAYPGFRPEKHLRKLGSAHGCLLGVFYPEESGHRQSGTGLTFVLFGRPNKDGRIPANYVKAYRAGADYALFRFGSYGSIADRKILLAGFGNLGSAVAATLCKLGVQDLTLVDRDIFEPGNIVRHWLGMQDYGRDKVEAGAKALGAAYPYTSVKALSYRLGDIGTIDKTTELFQFLDASDVYFDCSGERAVQHFLSNEAWDRGKDYVFVEGYPGMLGGFAGLIRPGKGPCFLCFLAGRADGSIALPPVLADGKIQPPGCGEPTFVGTPFDSDTIAAAAVRKIFSALTTQGNYPRDSEAYCRIVLANDDCTQSMARVEPVTVQKRAACALCGTR